MKIHLNKLLIICTFAFSSLSCFSEESIECKEFKRQVLSKAIDKITALNQVNSRASSKDSCAKNLMGIMYAQGIYVEMDFNKAYSIFNDLSNLNYPPSQLNLGILISQRPDHDSATLINYFLGLSIKYMSTREWGYIGASARDYARYYITELRGRDSSVDVVKRLEEDFEFNLKNGMIQIHQSFINKKQEQIEFEDSVMSIVMIGVMASNMKNISSRSAARPSSPPPTPGMPNRLYSVTPVGSNMLYMIPLN